MTTVSPAACNPASSTADLTWALGVSGENWMPDRSPPRMVTGGRSPGPAVTAAPIWVSGPMIRRIGRRDSEASPIKVDKNGWAATTPASIRIVLPELPQSSGADAARRPRRPRPSMVTSGGSSPARAGVRETMAPSCADAGERRRAIGAGRVVGNGGSAVGDGGQESVTMRDRFVAGHAQHARDAAARGRRQRGRPLA